MKQHELEACRERLDEHLAVVLYPSCERSQQRKWGSVYACGLLLEDGRKSAGAMAERLPDGNEQSLQQFISQSTWDFRAVQQRLAERVVAQLPKQGLWVFNDTGFPKCGTHSVVTPPRRGASRSTSSFTSPRSGSTTKTGVGRPVSLRTPPFRPNGRWPTPCWIGFAHGG